MIRKHQYLRLVGKYFTSIVRYFFPPASPFCNSRSISVAFPLALRLYRRRTIYHNSVKQKKHLPKRLDNDKGNKDGAHHLGPQSGRDTVEQIQILLHVEQRLPPPPHQIHRLPVRLDILRLLRVLGYGCSFKYVYSPSHLRLPPLALQGPANCESKG